jgi:hypothetical protein
MDRVFASCRLVAAFALAACWIMPVQAAENAFLATPVGPETVIFDPRRDACDGHDVPDMPLRAWRGPEGKIHAFALHYENRRMSGASILSLRPECAVVFRGTGNPDPAAYDDRAWIAATWSPDGRNLHALVHHEYQANTHPGRCRFSEYLKCWLNSILALRSEDGGRSFQRSEPFVIAATPFRQEVDQGRHRGFFNPSNIIRKDGWFYTLIGTTGWEGTAGQPDQKAGVCLFRTENLARGAWRAFARRFDSEFPGPDAGGKRLSEGCAPLSPFPAPVGAIVRHRPSGRYLAIYQAASGASNGRSGRLRESGFYLSASDDLLAWSAPTLVLATKSYYDSACGEAFVRNYPVLIDEAAETRNFEDIGDEALLVFAETKVAGCTPTSDRRLIARKVRISTFRRE